MVEDNIFPGLQEEEEEEEEEEGGILTFARRNFRMFLLPLLCTRFVMSFASREAAWDAHGCSTLRSISGLCMNK